MHLPTQATESDHSVSITVLPSSSGSHNEQVNTSSDEEILQCPSNPAESSFDNNQGTSRHADMKDKCFDSFKTWSGKLEREISSFRGKSREPDVEVDGSQTETEHAPDVNRYFDALEGPELDTLRVCNLPSFFIVWHFL